MGNDSNKPSQAPPLSLDDQMIELRMASKRFEMESKRSEREKGKQMNKAKQAVSKGNEEGARLFLANAAMKQKESLSQLRMAHKLDAIQSSLRSNMNNQNMMTHLNRLTPILQQTAQEQPLEEIYKDMNQFEQAMDDLMVQNNIVNQVMNKNTNDPN